MPVARKRMAKRRTGNRAQSGNRPPGSDEDGLQSSSLWMRLSRWAHFGLLAVLILLASGFALMGSSPRFTLHNLGMTVGHIEGTSMEPVLRHADTVVIESKARGAVKAGDVVLYRRDGKLILHRIVAEHVDENGSLWFVTRGDNVSSSDALISESQIEGRLVAIVPVLGSISRGLDHAGIHLPWPWTSALTIALLGAPIAILLGFLIHFGRSRRIPKV